jgi:hypothetical protein
MACKICGAPAMMKKCAKCRIQGALVRRRVKRPRAKPIEIVTTPPLQITHFEEVKDETKTKAKPSIPAEPEKVEPADVAQGSLLVRAVDNSTVPKRGSRQRIPKQIWTVDAEEFREEVFSAPQLRRPKP